MSGQALRDHKEEHQGRFIPDQQTLNFPKLSHRQQADTRSLDMALDHIIMNSRLPVVLSQNDIKDTTIPLEKSPIVVHRACDGSETKVENAAQVNGVQKHDNTAKFNQIPTVKLFALDNRTIIGKEIPFRIESTI